MSLEEVQAAEVDFEKALEGETGDDAYLIAAALNLLGLRIADALDDIRSRLDLLIDR